MRAGKGHDDCIIKYLGDMTALASLIPRSSRNLYALKRYDVRSTKNNFEAFGPAQVDDATPGQLVVGLAIRSA